MLSQRRITRADFLLLVATAAFVGACGDSTKSPAAIQEAVKLSSEEKLAALATQAREGDVLAQFKLGVMYFQGDGVAKDAVKAAEWFQKAAAQDDAPAQRNLGHMYAKGEGVAQDAAKAVEWYQKAATKGNALAQYYLGRMYVNGDGVGKDAVKAAEWFQKAAAQGDASAQIELGSMYATGEGVAQDAAKAVEWYQKAATKGDASAQYYLGRMYAEGYGIIKDAVTAAEWLQKAAAQGDASAQKMLGFMYYNGDGVVRDAVTAAEWIQKAAVQEDAYAQFLMGLMYAEGDGVAKDTARAVDWFQKAAAQGHAEAQYNLSQQYFQGDGVPKDVALAYAWVNLAARSEAMKDKSSRQRSLLERLMTRAEVAEGQRLSSGWKKGQVLVRESKLAAASAPPGILGKKGTGTIFVVSKTGQAVTNHHLVSDCTELRIQGRDGIAKVVTEDTVNDLALVQLQGAANDTAAITAEPGKVRQGEDIVAFGFPLNAVLSAGGNLTPGVVSALTGLGNNTNQIQITAPIQPGSSGSPVLNKKAEVVGVVSMKLSDAQMAKTTGQVGQNVNFAVSGQTLKAFLDTHKVTYSNGTGFFSREKSMADLADEARKWTLVVECWK